MENMNLKYKGYKGDGENIRILIQNLNGTGDKVVLFMRDKP